MRTRRRCCSSTRERGISSSASFATPQAEGAGRASDAATEATKNTGAKPFAGNGKPRSNPESFVNTVGMKMKLIPAGEFEMGLSDQQAELLLKRLPQVRRGDLTKSLPRHHVRITRPFYMGATEVTRGQFRRFVESEGHQTQSPGNILNVERVDFEDHPSSTWLNPGFAQTDDHPVVEIGWADAVAFCRG